MEKRDVEKSRGKKSDPLQSFLIFSALVLIGMYFIDAHYSSTLEESAQRAEEYTRRLGGDCIVHSSGLRGEDFVVSCPNEKKTEALFLRVKKELKLESFILKTSYASLLCEDECEELKK